MKKQKHLIKEIPTLSGKEANKFAKDMLDKEKPFNHIEGISYPNPNYKEKLKLKSKIVVIDDEEYNRIIDIIRKELQSKIMKIYESNWKKGIILTPREFGDMINKLFE